MENVEAINKNHYKFCQHNFISQTLIPVLKDGKKLVIIYDNCGICREKFRRPKLFDINDFSGNFKKDLLNALENNNKKVGNKMEIKYLDNSANKNKIIRILENLKENRDITRIEIIDSNIWIRFNINNQEETIIIDNNKANDITNHINYLTKLINNNNFEINLLSEIKEKLEQK